MMSKSFEEFFSELNSMNIQDHDLYLEEALKNLKKCTAPFEVRDIVEQQQAEIERLKKILAEEEEKYKLCAKRFYKVGVKDFAEKLKSTYFIDSERLCCQVDKVFKEMAGDTE